MTHRIEFFFFWTSSQYDSKSWSLFTVWLQEFNFSCVPIWLKELNLFFSSIWLKELCVCFFDLTQRMFLKRLKKQSVELFEWLIELNYSKNVFEKRLKKQSVELFEWLIELNFFWIQLKELNPFFFFEYDAKNWTFFWIWRKELNSFWTWLERIEPLFEYDSKNWISFWVWLKKNRTLFFFFWIRLNESNPFFWMWLKLNFFGWKNSQNSQNCFFSHDWKNRTRFFQFDWKNWTFFDLTQRFDFIQCDPKNWFFLCIWLTELDPFSWIWLRELKFFLGFFTCLLFSKMTQRIEPFFLWMWRQEFELFFFEYDAKNWTLFQYDSKSWTFFFFLNMTRRIELFFEYDSNSWTFVWVWLKEVNFHLWISLKELNFFLWMWLKEVSFFFEHDSKKWTFLNITHRIEPFFLKKKRRKELNLFQNLTQRIEPFSKYDSKNWTFSQNDSKNWIFF